MSVAAGFSHRNNPLRDGGHERPKSVQARWPAEERTGVQTAARDEPIGRVEPV